MIQLRRIKCAAVAVALVSAFSAVALDNAQNNDFWDTTGYENATPVVQTNEMYMDLELEDVVPAYESVASFGSFAYSLAISNTLNLFNSRPPKGMTVVFR